MMIGAAALTGLSEFRATVGRMVLAFFGEGESYYINGPDILPPPLTPEEESEILARFDEDRSLADILIRRNLRLVVYIAKKFDSCGTGIEDLISIGTIGLIKGVDSFRSDKNIRLATYVSRCIENEILMHFRSLKKTANDVSINDEIDTDKDGNPLSLMDVVAEEDTILDDVFRSIRTEKLLSAITQCLDERETTVIRLRYGLSEPARTQKETAERLGISRSYVSRIEKSALMKLKSALEYCKGI